MSVFDFGRRRRLHVNPDRRDVFAVGVYPGPNSLRIVNGGALGRGTGEVLLDRDEEEQLRQLLNERALADVDATKRRR